MAAVTEEKLSSIDKLCRQSIQKYLDIKGIPYEKQGYYLMSILLMIVIILISNVRIKYVGLQPVRC